MTKRIFRTIFIVAISVFVASAVLFMTALYNYFSDVGQDQLKMQTELAAQGVANEGIGYFDGLESQNYRITWIGTDGSVLYDSISAVDDMENHLGREEVKEALAQGYGESSRYSATLTERYLYNAKRLPNGTVIRLSVTQNSMLVLTLGILQPICIIFAIAIILSAFLASRLSKKIVKPLNELNLDDPLNNDEYDELSPLLCRVDTQQRQIRQQKEELKRKQSEFEAITSGMAEGIILLNQKGTILSMNRAALRILNTDLFAVGEDILSINRSLTITELLHKAESGEHAEAVMELGNGKYQLDASSIVTNNEVIGIVILLLDVTEKEKAEQLRREFTANVSHELKSPLHAISGYAELLSNGIVKPEDITEFSKRIYMEAGRMIRLVEDIIKLSHLDEGADDMKREDTDLFAVADYAVTALTPEAEQSGIKIELYGEAAVLYGVPHLLESIVYNLCDNAIKYNKKGGSVCVTVKNEEEFIILSVIDTGIGIPKECQERIFERFYRVDKSRSKEIGGTGLGLSIVKHAAKLHNAKIELQSAINTGTTVTVKFPRK